MYTRAKKRKRGKFRRRKENKFEFFIERRAEEFRNELYSIYFENLIFPKLFPFFSHDKVGEKNQELVDEKLNYRQRFLLCFILSSALRTQLLFFTIFSITRSMTKGTRVNDER